MLAVARGSHSCAAEIDLGTTTPRKKPGPENLGSGDETRELHKTRVFHQIFNAADGPEKSGFRACLTEIRPKPPSINPQTRKKSHNQNPGFARKTQVTHSPIPGLSRVSPRSRVFPGCLCCVLAGQRGRSYLGVMCNLEAPRIYAASRGHSPTMGGWNKHKLVAVTALADLGSA